MSETNSLAGTHRARAVEWALGMSTTGKEQIAVMFQLTQGPHEGKHITWFGFFTDSTVERTLESLRHCGWDSDSLAELDHLDANEVELVIDDETYEGKTRSKVKWVNRVSKLALKEQMSPAQVQAFAAKLRGKTVAHKRKYDAGGSAGGAKPRAQQQNFSGGEYGPDDSDIPF